MAGFARDAERWEKRLAELERENLVLRAALKAGNGNAAAVGGGP